MSGLQMMTTYSEQVLNGTVNGEKTLGLCNRFEPPHLPLLFTSVLMGHFGPIVFVLACSMDHKREDVPMRSRITPQLVGDQLPGCLYLLFQGLTKEAFSGSTISSLGDQNIDHVSILIDGPPKIEALTLDGEEEFIDVPDVAESSLFPTQSSGVRRSEFLTPISDRFVGDKDSSLCK
jgi:hypothetical protein